jgi:hypothetical protein
VREAGVRQFLEWYSNLMQARLAGENLTDVA